MELNSLIKRIRFLIVNPVDEWKSIEDEGLSIKNIIIDYAGPLITVGAITLFVRNLFLTFTFIATLFSAVIYFISMFSGIYFSTLILYELADNFGIEKNKRKIFTLITYSSTAFLLVKAIVNLSDQFALLNLLSIYSGYLLWIGFDVCFHDIKKSKIGIVLISLLLVFTIYILFQYLLSPLLTLTNSPQLFS
ncbi:MAG: hypothetical protein GXO79_04515 [Chlorobi bacterium]|nr:hypothetical protein [Chlorobiota bacterium]